MSMVNTCIEGAMELKTQSLPLDVPCQYYFEETGSDELFILLHGYTQKAEKIHRFFGPALPKNVNVLVPTAPFPLPKKVELGYEVGYSWFFYDIHARQYLITQKPAVDWLKSLLAALGQSNKKITIVGYSQGGYLAPFLALELPKVSRVIVVAGEYIPTLPADEIQFRCDLIYGSQDEVVNPEHMDRHYEQLKSSSPRLTGEKICLDKIGHKLSPIYTETLKNLLNLQ